MVKKNLIKDYFDQSPENEDLIIANILKKMSEPEVNIDQFPDSVLNKLTVQEEEVNTQDELPLVVQQENVITNINDSINSNNNLIIQKEKLIESKKQTINQIKNQNLIVQNVAKLKAEESQELAQKAEDILQEMELETNQEDSIVNQQLKKQRSTT